ncbi:P-loop containing nucleoside triphosphate hydrolase protein, partial [Mycotypha africana]|uniref:P-loop containing nucleoside triphosphate hydrolase protein n=1 Tax=Mycotypha africana TaxID=64632 RepID=UPI0023011D03
MAKANCISYIPNEPQIFIGQNRSFTFDSVYPSKSTQQEIYNFSVTPLLEQYMEGKNATVLAYGQTGSGKSYSMGMTVEPCVNLEEQGIVPRFVNALFDRISSMKSTTELGLTTSTKEEARECQVSVTFLELYNEDLRDLLVLPNGSNDSLNDSQQTDNHLSIREDIDGNIYCPGIKEEKVESAEDVLRLLRKGLQQRTTGTTEMNESSSRSHAIFTVVLKQKLNNRTLNMSKFHFVDLAGSERLKRTLAVGDRQKEGISINGELLALGKVISALGDNSRRRMTGQQQHIPYRDSKLTRLLQDSLGGNSCTLMLACISPASLDYAETLNTLKYANRARNIENRVAINHE